MADPLQQNDQHLHYDAKASNKFLYIFAWFWSGVSTLYFFSVTFLTISEPGRRYADIILGFLLGTIVATIIGYFFGNAEKKV